jgi:ATP-dependent Clp protease ATP-binding subunit ClpC
VFERFTDPARNTIVLAQEEARLLDHDYIGTEHILLALLADESSIAGEVLDGLGLTREGVRAEVIEVVGRGPGAVSGQTPFTARSKKVLELSLREALQRGHNYIGTEHILLGLTKLTDGPAHDLLARHGASSDQVRLAVRARLEEGPPRRRGRRRLFGVPPMPVTLELGGPRLPHCSFCGRRQPAVSVLLAGAGDALICGECVEAAMALVEEARSLPGEPGVRPASGPRIVPPDDPA